MYFSSFKTQNNVPLRNITVQELFSQFTEHGNPYPSHYWRSKGKIGRALQTNLKNFCQIRSKTTTVVDSQTQLFYLKHNYWHTCQSNERINALM